VDVGLRVLGQVRKRCAAGAVEGSILALPFVDGSFDVVLSTEVIEHTPGPTEGLRELCRVLRRGGRLIVTSPNRLWQPVVRLATAVGLRHSAAHENFLWPGRARAVVQACGVRVERLVGFNLLPLFFEILEPVHRRADRLGSASRQPFVNWAIVGTKPEVESGHADRHSPST
jgi:SAM-dependent methyltransferase